MSHFKLVLYCPVLGLVQFGLIPVRTILQIVINIQVLKKNSFFLYNPDKSL